MQYNSWPLLRYNVLLLGVHIPCTIFSLRRIPAFPPRREVCRAGGKQGVLRRVNIRTSTAAWSIARGNKD